MDRNARPCENTSRFFEGRAIVERIVGDERNEPRRLIFRDRLEEDSFLLLPDFESSHKCTAAEEPPPLRFLISPSSCSPQFFHGGRKQRGDEEKKRRGRTNEKERAREKGDKK